jgi:hypothetical protein
MYRRVISFSHCAPDYVKGITRPGWTLVDAPRTCEYLSEQSTYNDRIGRRSIISTSTDVANIGAGPFGLSIAARVPAIDVHIRRRSA